MIIGHAFQTRRAGADGKTYSNACYAGCARAAVSFQGPCERRRAKASATPGKTA